jgi:hypothetical protein
MKRIVTTLSVAMFVLMTSGCVVTNLSSEIDPNTDMDSLKTFYVVRQPNDRRGIEKMISDELQSYGLTSNYGEAADAPSIVDSTVTYVDKWMWDLTNYLIELTIDIRHPETQYKMASGISYRTSLARKSPEEMVKEVLGDIYGKQPTENN